ncbi:MAG TPA: NTF2 fold immunity protein [Terriglobales bacterium]|nr:NTF2 fold immunity protein [Terriglobales bacterium]
MKFRTLLCGLFLMTSAAGQNGQPAGSYVPTGGYVPSEAVAEKIAEAVLFPVYGEKQIASERPFHAILQGDVWTVRGTLYCPDGKGGTTTNNCVGGTAVVKLSKIDARILFMMHYK